MRSFFFYFFYDVWLFALLLRPTPRRYPNAKALANLTNSTLLYSAPLAWVVHEVPLSGAFTTKIFIRVKPRRKIVTDRDFVFQD